MGSQYLSWFPTKRTQTNKIHKIMHRYTKEAIMKEHYPKIYQFHRDMTSWRKFHYSRMSMATVTRENRKKYFQIPTSNISNTSNESNDTTWNSATKFVQEQRKMRSLFTISDYSDFNSFVRFLVTLDSLDPHPDHPMLISFFLDVWSYFCNEFCEMPRKLSQT